MYNIIYIYICTYVSYAHHVCNFFCVPFDDKLKPNTFFRGLSYATSRLAFLLNKKTPLPDSLREHLTRALALLASREASRVSVKESGAPEAL